MNMQTAKNKRKNQRWATKIPEWNEKWNNWNNNIQIKQENWEHLTAKVSSLSFQERYLTQFMEEFIAPFSLFQ